MRICTIMELRVTLESFMSQFISICSFLEDSLFVIRGGKKQISPLDAKFYALKTWCRGVHFQLYYLVNPLQVHHIYNRLKRKRQHGDLIFCLMIIKYVVALLSCLLRMHNKLPVVIVGKEFAAESCPQHDSYHKSSVKLAYPFVSQKMFIHIQANFILSDKFIYNNVWSVR